MTSQATRLDIDLDAIAANWRLLRNRHGAGATSAVVKADGYGLGAIPVARRLHTEGCRHFFVAHLTEALALRPHVPGALLATLNGLWPGDARDHAAHEIVPVLGSLAEITAWADEAARRDRALPALLHVDTGMNRLGLDSQELAVLCDQPERLQGIRLLYVMTHLVSPELPGDPVNRAQLDRFQRACAALPAAPHSLAASSGLFLGEAYRSDLSRPGAALYGLNPTPGQPNPMRPVVRLRARVLQVREIGAGERVGYNGIWQAERRSRIATVSVGYADGYSRHLSNNGQAFFDGAPLPLVGRVSMDLSTFDATDHPAVAPGAWLDLMGDGQTPDDIARRAGTNGYEVLTRLGHRFGRRYLPG